MCSPDDGLELGSSPLQLADLTLGREAFSGDAGSLSDFFSALALVGGMELPFVTLGLVPVLTDAAGFGAGSPLEAQVSGFDWSWFSDLAFTLIFGLTRAVFSVGFAAVFATTFFTSFPLRSSSFPFPVEFLVMWVVCPEAPKESDFIFLQLGKPQSESLLCSVV